MDKIDELMDEILVSWIDDAHGRYDKARAALRAEYERMENDNARMKAALEKICKWSGTYPSDTFSMSRAIDSIFRIAREGLEK